MDPKDYIIELDTMTVKEGFCAIAFRKNRADFFIMGNSFMRGYYAMHDASPTNGSLSFIPSKNSNKNMPVAGTIPLRFLQEQMPQSIYTWMITFAVIGGWCAAETWGIRPEIMKWEVGKWTDLVLNTSFDTVIAGAMWFYAVPAMNGAFANTDGEAFVKGSTLNPDINFTEFLQMAAGVSAVAWAGRAHKRARTAKKAKKAAKVDNKEELMLALANLANSNSLE
jgi:hypothetical protein